MFKLSSRRLQAEFLVMKSDLSSANVQRSLRFRDSQDLHPAPAPEKGFEEPLVGGGVGPDSGLPEPSFPHPYDVVRRQHSVHPQARVLQLYRLPFRAYNCSGADGTYTYYMAKYSLSCSLCIPTFRYTQPKQSVSVCSPSYYPIAVALWQFNCKLCLASCLAPQIPEGTVRLFNVKNYESDILSSSVGQVKLGEGSQHQFFDLRVLAETSSVAVGLRSGLRIYNLEVGKQKCLWTEPSEPLLLATMARDQGHLVLSASADRELKVYDLRTSRPALSCPLGCSGYPSSLTPYGKRNQSAVVSTLSGLLLRYDLRANIVNSVYQYLDAGDSPCPITGTFGLDSQLAITFPCRTHEFEIYELGTQSRITCASHFLSTGGKPSFQCNYLQELPFQKYVGWRSLELTRRQAMCSLLADTRIEQLCSFLNNPLRHQARLARLNHMRSSKDMLVRLNEFRKSLLVPFVIGKADYLVTNFNPGQQQEGDLKPYLLLPRRRGLKREENLLLQETTFFDEQCVWVPRVQGCASYTSGCLVDNYVVVAGRDQDHFVKIIY